MTAVDDAEGRTIFFAAIQGVPPEFAFNKNVGTVETSGQVVTNAPGEMIVRNVNPGTGFALKIAGRNDRIVRIVVVDSSASLGLWKGNWRGRDRVFLTHAGLVLDGDDLRLTSSSVSDLSVGVYPAPASVEAGSHALEGKPDGIFRRFTPPAPAESRFTATAEKIQSAGPARDIPIGSIDRPVATAPLDKDFEKAAVWRIRLSGGINPARDPILRLRYTGDVARVTLNGKLLTDDFYNGNAFEIGLRRYLPEILNGELRLEILPLRKDAPIFMAPSARPAFSDAGDVATLECAEIVARYKLQMTAR